MSEEIVNNQEVELEVQTNEDDTELDLVLEDEEEVETEETIDWEARAKKAEALLVQRKKQAKTQIKPAQPLQNTLTEEAVEIKILKSQGKTDDEITQLKKIARVNETSIFDAQSDPYFVAWKEAKDQEAKSVRAKLPASKGSSSVRQSKDFTSRDLSDEEHKELWKQRQA